jgi:hypothetical protein
MGLLLSSMRTAAKRHWRMPMIAMDESYREIL